MDNTMTVEMDEDHFEYMSADETEQVSGAGFWLIFALGALAPVFSFGVAAAKPYAAAAAKKNRGRGTKGGRAVAARRNGAGNRGKPSKRRGRGSQFG